LARLDHFNNTTITLEYFVVFLWPTFRYAVTSTYDPFRVVAARVPTQVSHGDQNPSTNSSSWQSPIRYKVIESTLADGKELGRLFAAYQQLCVRCNDYSARLLLAYAVDYLHWCTPSIEIPFCSHPQP
jgi:hypothetical protein